MGEKGGDLKVDKGGKEITFDGRVKGSFTGKPNPLKPTLLRYPKDIELSINTQVVSELILVLWGQIKDYLKRFPHKNPS